MGVTSEILLSISIKIYTYHPPQLVVFRHEPNLSNFSLLAIAVYKQQLRSLLLLR
ncbi:hypothetical protein PN499_25705 [Kamptonema animale CS-326]|uniref:hypothetical protein n=1 Tax=Kamptonema TaxID=1501433 RepID=UPI00031A924C|nr:MULTISPECIES: hypothetical protein [Kamptonema]MDB9514600.1 hypothetical protein [Kamptonema animale CS-326]